jgi:DNA invertase Pin-like site-specific DNA recombinase
MSTIAYIAEWAKTLPAKEQEALLAPFSDHIVHEGDIRWDTGRPKLRSTFKSLEEGDTLLIYSVEIIAMQLTTLNSTMRLLLKNKINLRVYNIDFELTFDKKITLIEYIEFQAQVEHHYRSLRQMKTQPTGLKIGRQFKLNDSDVPSIIRDLQSGNFNSIELSKKYKVARSTLYKFIQRHGIGRT